MPWGYVAAAAISGVAAYASRPDTPDYGAVSAASERSAELSAQLGREQLAFAQRQYDENVAIARPIISTQQQIMQQGLSQGDDLYRYGQSFRPLEQEMMAQARGGLTAADVVRMNRSGLGDLRFAQPQAIAPARTAAALPQQQQPAAPPPAAAAPSAQPQPSFGGGGGESFGRTYVDPATGIRHYADGSTYQLTPNELQLYNNENRARSFSDQLTGNGGGTPLVGMPQTNAAIAPQPTDGLQKTSLASNLNQRTPAVGMSQPQQAAPAPAPIPAAAPAASQPQAPGGVMSAAQIAQSNAGARSAALSTAQQQWQQDLDSRRTALVRQVEQARQEEEAIRQREIATAQARTQGLSMSYIDAQGNVRSADSYRNIAASTAQRDGSPGDGYQYFEFDNPNAGQQTSRTETLGDGERTVYDTAPDRTGAWLRTGQVGVADPSLAGVTPTVDPKSLRSYQLQQQIDALSAERFDPNKVDYSAADRAQGTQAMDGAMVRAMMDQREMDQITGTAQSNADRLAARTRAYEDETYKDIQDYTGGNSRILDRYRSDIDADVGRAVSDARMGQTSATNAALRQAMRYGLSVPGAVSSLTSGQASQLAAAANNTRNSAVDSYRSLVGQGIGLKRDAFSTGQAATLDSMNKGEQALRAGRDMRIQNESLDWAKKLDVAGLARGMSGASQGAYSVATNAGNSAVSNQMAPGQAMQGAMAQSANTQLSGRQIAQQGLGSVLGAQSSAYNTQLQQFNNVLGTAAGGAYGYAANRPS